MQQKQSGRIDPIISLKKSIEEIGRVRSLREVFWDQMGLILRRVFTLESRHYAHSKIDKNRRKLLE